MTVIYLSFVRPLYNALSVDSSIPPSSDDTLSSRFLFFDSVDPEVVPFATFVVISALGLLTLYDYIVALISATLF